MFTQQNIEAISRMTTAASKLYDKARDDPAESDEIRSLTLHIVASLKRLEWQLAWQQANGVAPPRLFR